MAPLEFEFKGPSLPAAKVVGDPRVPPTVDIFENVAALVWDVFGTLSFPPIVLSRPLSVVPPTPPPPP